MGRSSCYIYDEKNHTYSVKNSAIETHKNIIDIDVSTNKQTNTNHMAKHLIKWTFMLLQNPMNPSVCLCFGFSLSIFVYLWWLLFHVLSYVQTTKICNNKKRKSIIHSTFFSSWILCCCCSILSIFNPKQSTSSI